MIGSVDTSGRALLSIELRRDAQSLPNPVEAWIDTGFTGDLVMPQTTIDHLQLQRSGSVDAILADGSQIQLATFTCFVDWFGQRRRLEVIANDGDFPLLGVGLLLELDLRINYHTLELTLTLP
jgi:clan AA aspartic protease